MDVSNVDDLKIAVKLAGIKATKGLGQHFLVDKGSMEAVVAGGELIPNDIVLEIGPGLGVMTIPLTRKVDRVIAVEMDQTLARLLERDRPANLEVRRGNILELDMSMLPAEYKIIANIPYYLTSKIFRLFLETENKPSIMSVLIQKEVAQRVAARPGQMSVLAFCVQYYGKPTILKDVERHKFWPAPKVDSSILQIKVYDRPVFPAHRERLFRLVKAGFGEKRKMLKNSLAGGLNVSMDLVLKLISDAKLAPTSRAQELSMDDWQRLYAVTSKARII